MQSSAQVVITKPVTQAKAISTAELLALDGYSVELLADVGNAGIESPVWTLSIDATASHAQALWASLSDTCVDDYGCLDEDWMLFDAGTDRVSIWAWFESQFNVSAAWLMGLEKSARETADDDFFQSQIRSLDEVLKTFPGDIHEGDITGHGLEWRAELLIDEVPSSESDDTSDGYVLVFALENLAGNLRPDLRLEYHVAEAGLSEKQNLDLSDLTTIGQQFDRLIIEWDVDPVANLTATPFLNKVCELFSFASLSCVVADGKRHETLNV